jgi:hypothetical protein
MGWFEQDLNQIKTCSHGGNLPDFSAFMGLIPGQKKALVVLFNADPYGLPFITDEIGMGLTALLAGQSPPPIRLDFIQWIVRLLPLIPLLQIAGVFSTLRKLRRWKSDPPLRPARGLMWREQILPPLIPNLSLAAILVYLRSSGLLRYMHLYNPDVSWIARISGGFAGVWALLRTGLILQARRKPRA